MAFENVILVAGGQAFEGWESISVTYGFNQACPQAIIRVSEVPDDKSGSPQSFWEKWHFPPYTSVQLYASGTLILTGYVDTYQPSMSPGEHSVTLIVRGNQMNIVDSSAYHPTGEWQNVQAHEIVADLASYVGVQVTSGGDPGQPVKSFRIRKGGNIFAESIRLLQTKMATIYGDVKGQAVVAYYGYKAGNHPGAIRLGVEIQECQAKLSGGGRFDTYYSIMQNPLGVEDEDFEGEGVAKDPGVPLKRNKIIVQTMPGTSEDVQRRAVQEAARAFGYSCEADLTVRGWRDQAGTIWQAGYTVWVTAGALKIDQAMLIEGVELRQENEPVGTVASLHVVNPMAYGIQGTAGGSNQMWTQAPPLLDDQGEEDSDE